jgi:hypothetical protein
MHWLLSALPGFANTSPFIMLFGRLNDGRSTRRLHSRGVPGPVCTGTAHAPFFLLSMCRSWKDMALTRRAYRISVCGAFRLTIMARNLCLVSGSTAFCGFCYMVACVLRVLLARTFLLPLRQGFCHQSFRHLYSAP